MPFEKEDRIRESTRSDVAWFFRNASARDWDGIEPPFIDCGRLRDCDGFLVAEYGGEVIGAIATSLKGMDGSNLPTIANLYVLRDFMRNGVGSRLLVAAMECLLAGIPKVFCKAITPGMTNTINKLPSGIKERLDYKVDLCGAEAWEAWEHMKGRD
jgi:GNAT superfamily N-acetyltransferase